MADDNIIDAAPRFMRRDQRRTARGVETVQERERACANGNLALQTLEACKKLPLGDRETIARQLGFRLHSAKLDQVLVAKRARLEAKEMYRLVVRYGQAGPDKYRLRASGGHYADVIKALAELLPTNVADLADRVTRGTSVHPLGISSSSRATTLLKILYNLADGLDERFQLSKHFAAIAQEKREDRVTEPWALWPAELAEETRKEAARFAELGVAVEPPQEERLHGKFWIGRTSEERAASLRRLARDAQLLGRDVTADEIAAVETDSSFGFENPAWDQIIGYLPHFFLGHQRDFAWDVDYWPPPKGLADSDDADEQRMAYLADAMFTVLGSNPRVSTKWDDAGQLLFNDEPAIAYRRRIAQFYRRHCMTAQPEDWESCDEETDDIFSGDQPAFFWLCLYPNADVTGLVPVVISTNWSYGKENTIELIDERILANMEYFDVLGGATLGERLRSAIMGPKPALRAEWTRTARWVERHPLWQRHQRYQLAAKEAADWRAQILKGELAPTDDQGGTEHDQ